MSEETEVKNDANCLGCLVIASVMGFLLLVIGVPVYISVLNDNAARAARVADRTAVVEANGGKFKVLHIYPRYVTVGKAQTMMSGHTAVLEGVKDGKRVEALATGPYPVPGETWEVELSPDGSHYVLVKLVGR